MSEPILDGIRLRALAAITTPAETYKANRYPYAYSADFLRQHESLIPVDIYTQVAVFGHALSRGEAARAKSLWAESIGVDAHELAQVFADCYLAEHGIPLAMADAERRQSAGSAGPAGSGLSGGTPR
jgi:hypothetical protein